MEIVDYLIGKKAGGGGVVHNQTKTVNPSTSSQEVIPDTGYTGLSKVTVNAVTSTIDSNIVASNIKSGVTILGVEGNVEPDKPDQTKTVNPSTSSQTITADTGYELASVTVNPVTSSIDSNITAGNIKKNVTILGVTGTVEGGKDWSAIGYSGEPDFIDNGYTYAKQIYDNWDPNPSGGTISSKYQNDNNIIFFPNVDMSNITDIRSCFRNSSLTYIDKDIDFSNIGQVSSCFRDCGHLQNLPYLDLSNCREMDSFLRDSLVNGNITIKVSDKLTTFQYSFYNCKRIKNLIINGSTENVADMSNMVNGCTALTSINLIDCSSCTSVNGFAGNTGLVDVGGLKDLGKAYLTTAPANNYGYTLSFTNNRTLTHDSLMNIINNLYDIATAGCNTQTVQIGATNLAKLTAEEISIGTNKGWSIS